MSKELIERLRNAAILATSECAWLMTEAADALEAKAAPVGDDRGHDTKGSRKALGAMNAKLAKIKAKIGRLEREQAAYQRAQPQSAEAVAWMITYEDNDSLHCITQDKARADICDGMAYNVLPLYTTPQPSAGVVMPGRAEVSVRHGYRAMGYAEGWNDCLDEVASLNKGAGLHE